MFMILRLASASLIEAPAHEPQKAVLLASQFANQ
jgi:hypothetical protein